MWWGANALDPDREEAQTLLREELTDGYQLQPSLLERAIDWVTGLFDSVVSSDIRDGVYIVIGLVLLVGIGAVVLYHLRHRSTLRQESSGDDEAVLGASPLSPDAYRSRASAAMAQGDHAGAVMDGFRAVTAQADLDTLLDHAVASTVSEVVEALRRAYSQHQSEIEIAGQVFDRTRYGEIAPSAADAQQILDLDTNLRRAAPQLEALA